MPVISPQGLESKSCYTCANGPTAKSVERIELWLCNWLYL